MTFWIGIVLCLAAIVIYVWSDDLFLATHVARSVRIIGNWAASFIQWEGPHD